MKLNKLKKALLVFTLLVISNSCSTDKINVTLVEGPPPSELSTTVVVAEDNSGNVTVTPIAVGASSYRVFFGDVEEESPVVLGRGATTVHTYKEEGSYTVKVIAVAPNDRTNEETFQITVSLKAILNFSSGITVNEDNISEITFEPSADNATSFEILFGDIPNEDTTIVQAGETVTHEYPSFGIFTVTFTAIGADGRTAEFTEEVNAGDPLGFPINFDSSTVTYNFLTFNGSSYMVVENPDPSGANDEISNVGAITNTGNVFEGGIMVLDTPIDFSGSNKTITMKFWSNVSVPIVLKFENGVNGERENEVIVTHGGTGWEDLEFNFNTSAKKSFIDGNQGFGEAFVPTGLYAQLAIFIDGPGTTAGTFYMDDLVQTASDDNPSGGSDCNSSIFGTPISFENSETFNPFNGASYAIVDNPDPTGANASVSKVGALTNAGGAFEGYSLSLGTPANFSDDNKVVTLKFWSNISVPIRLDMDNGVAGARSVEVNLTHGGTGWEELSFDFNTAVKTFLDGNQGFGEPLTPTGEYGGITIFIDGPGTTAGTFYIDDIGVCNDSSGGGSTTSVFSAPISFENSETFNPFNGASYAIVDNPDLTGANASVSKVGALTNAGGAFEGYSLSLETPANFSGDNKVVTLKFWSNISVPIRLDMDNGVAGARSVEVNLTHGGTGWEELSFDFNTAVKTFLDGNQGFGEPLIPTGEYGGITIFIDGPGTTAGTFYIDDIN